MLGKFTNLDDMIAHGEYVQQDFKFGITDSRKISRSLSAFANTIGGRLLIGVKDNGTIVGVKTEEEFYMVEAAAQLYSVPEIDFLSKAWNFEGKTVLEVRIEESTLKPHYVKNSDGTKNAYFRVKDENILASPVLIKVWQKQKQSRGTLVRYSIPESLVFKYLSEHDYLSLSKFKKLGRLRQKEAVETLANLLIFGLLRFESTDKQYIYRLAE